MDQYQIRAVGIYGYAAYSASKFGLKVWHSHCNKKLLLMIFMSLLFFLLTPIHLVLKKLGLGNATNEFPYEVGDRLHKGCTLWLGDMKI
ncbi:hypothetical protein YC2023_029765 [Brassica napus]